VVGDLNSYFKPQPNDFKKLWDGLEKDLAKDRTSKNATITHHLCITHPPDNPRFIQGVQFQLEYYYTDERDGRGVRSMTSVREIGGYDKLAMYYLEQGELPPQSLADLMGWMKKHPKTPRDKTLDTTNNTNPYKVVRLFEKEPLGLPDFGKGYYGVNIWTKRHWEEGRVESFVLNNVRVHKGTKKLPYWTQMDRPKKSKQAWIDFYYDSVGKTIPCEEDWLEERWLYDQDSKRQVRGYERRFVRNWELWKNRDIFAELWKQEPQMDAEDVMRIFAGVKGKSVEQKLVDYWC